VGVELIGMLAVCPTVDNVDLVVVPHSLTSITSRVQRWTRESISLGYRN
jgi:hypothetical protein